jgi:succinate-semialdehyde dehydrogenase/glutarate-semialdehyde dehydrogenase
MIADLIRRAGVPPGVVNVVVPRPTGPLVDRMLRDRRVLNLSFTGSTEVGRVLLHGAADRVVRTSMELGGNAPFLILSDADVPAAVEGALTAKLRNGGCACTAANRFYVAREVAADFMEAFAAAMAAVRYGPGLQPSSQLGAMISRRERDKIAELVDDALDDGARRLAGGRRPEGVGAYYPATVLAEVRADAALLKTEIFGPVAPIVVVDSDDEAIALANDTDAGLISYVFSGDRGRAMDVAERLDSGMVAVNRGVVSDPAAPFGGTKQSGLGREGGFHGIYEFLETKYIALDAQG